MKKIIALSTAAFLSTALYANTDMQAQLDELTAKIKKLEKKQKKNTKKISKVNALAAKDNIKFDVDFRTAYDNVNYETANGVKYGSKNGIYSNRLWLGMGYAPADDIVFKGQLAYHKAFGASYGQRGTGFGFDTFDWVSSETLNDDKVRVREAYWLWTPTTGDIGWTVSVGRRPSTNGFLANLRDDDPKAKSPLAHVINMEFDGASAGIKLDNYIPGMLFKICLGRGLSNATAWASQATSSLAPTGMESLMGASTQPDYTTDGSNLDNVDMAGFIFVPYDDGQYSIKSTWYRGFNVPGLVVTGVDYATGQAVPTGYALNNTGDMDGMALSVKVEGIGDGISDFLDETVLFASYAMSVSHPNKDRTVSVANGPITSMTVNKMLGSADSEAGNSIWVGAVIPNMTGGQFGVEYNKGSKYWRPFTYGEDTLTGSKLATRGSAIEAYWTQPLIKKVFSMQVRYTSLNYEYTGSNAFFGDGGTPMTMSEAKAAGMDPVEKASDLRVYFRYRY